MLSEEQVWELAQMAAQLRHTAHLSSVAAAKERQRKAAAIDALLADRTALAAEVERLRAAVAALADEFGTWADTSESLGGRYRERAIAYRACASSAAGVAAAEPRPAGDRAPPRSGGRAADDAKGDANE